MATHLLCALSVEFGIKENEMLVKLKRVLYQKGYYILSDIIIGDDEYWKENYTIFPIFNIEKIYKKSVCWNKIYVPSIEENIMVYEYFNKWFPRDMDPWLKYEDIQIMSQNLFKEMSSYTRACLAMCYTLRIMIDFEPVEIKNLCKKMLNKLKKYIILESIENKFDLTLFDTRLIIKKQHKKL